MKHNPVHLVCALFLMSLVTSACDDPADLSNNTNNTNNITETCNNGIDDDLNGTADCADPQCHSEPPCAVNGTLFVDFSFPSVERSRGVYIWIEDLDGTYVDTVQQYFGRGDDPNMQYDVLGMRFLNDVCTEWKAAAGETTALVLDGITTATPIGVGMSGDYTSESWDTLDRNGGLIPKAVYKVRVEITFDDTGHPIMPVHRYETLIDLAGPSSTATLSPVDEKMSQGIVTFTANP